MIPEVWTYPLEVVQLKFFLLCVIVSVIFLLNIKTYKMVVWKVNMW